MHSWKKGEHVVKTPHHFWTKNLIWILIIQVLTALVYHGYAALIPFIQTEYMLNKSEVGYLTSGMFLGSSLIAIPAGMITDRIGVRKTITLFCLIMVAVLYSFMITKSYMAIILLLICFGFGYGAMAPATNRGIMEGFTEKNRGTAMGFKQMGVPLGAVIASFILPALSYLYSWRIALFITGTLLLCTIIAYYVNNREQNSPATFLLSAESIKNVLMNKRTIQLAIIIAFFMGMQVSVTTFLVIYLYQTLHFSFVFSTFCFSLLFFGGAFGRGFWGYISDSYYNGQRKIILFYIGLLSVIALVLLGLINQSTPLVAMVCLSLFLGFTTQGWNGISIVMIAEKSSKLDIGLTTGFGLTIVNIGAIIGAPIAGFVIDASGSYQNMWWAIAVIILVVSIIAMKSNIESH